MSPIRLARVLSRALCWARVSVGRGSLDPAHCKTEGLHEFSPQSQIGTGWLGPECPTILASRSLGCRRLRPSHPNTSSPPTRRLTRGGWGSMPQGLGQQNSGASKTPPQPPHPSAFVGTGSCLHAALSVAGAECPRNLPCVTIVGRGSPDPAHCKTEGLHVFSPNRRLTRVGVADNGIV
jgi:hypothetical protein